MIYTYIIKNLSKINYEETPNTIFLCQNDFWRWLNQQTKTFNSVKRNNSTLNFTKLILICESFMWINFDVIFKNSNFLGLKAKKRQKLSFFYVHSWIINKTLHTPYRRLHTSHCECIIFSLQKTYGHNITQQ